MLSHLELHNFKAFADVAIDIKPITVLLGPNNSGKSSLMAALRLLTQTLESNDKQIPLLLNGIMGDFGTYQDVVYGNDMSKPITIGLITDSGDNFTLGYEYHHETREIILTGFNVKPPDQRDKIADIGPHLKNIHYIGPMRNPPARTYLFSGERRSRIGMFGENAINILTMKPQLAESVNAWLTKAGIATDFQVSPLTDRHYEIKVQHPITKEYQNLADVGYGNSQVIPVLIGGYNLKAGAIYLVEQPEIHLHPRAQAELGDFFLELYQNQVTTMIETHSEHLVLRLQQHVANQLIAPENIQFYYVYAKGEQKVAQAMHLDKQGRFIEEWPEGFFPERLAEAKNLSRLRAAHAEG